MSKKYVIDPNPPSFTAKHKDHVSCFGKSDTVPRCQCAEARPEGQREPGEGCIDENGNSGFLWCFLKYVSNPKNPAENCFEDATWSQTNGRFYSNLACESVGIFADEPPPPPIFD